MNRSFSRRAAELSRDRHFLIRASLILVAVSACVAFLLSLQSGKAPVSAPHPLPPEPGKEDPSSLPELISFFRFRGDYFVVHPLLLDCRYLSNREPDAENQEAFDSFLKSLTSREDVPLVEIWAEGFHPARRQEAIEKLKKESPDLRHRNEFLGDLYYLSDEKESALESYLEETENHPDSRYSRRSALYIAHWSEGSRFSELLSRPEFRSVLFPYELLNAYADNRDFLRLARVTFAVEWMRLNSIHLIPASIIAAIWFCILMAFWKLDQSRLIASLVAFSLGILSAALTLFAVFIQERTFGFDNDPPGSTLSQVIYWVSGVGLREETLKLLCFLPVALWTARRKSDIEALILAAVVGLGFAFQENIGYFHEDFDNFLPLGRMLQPSALHFSLTGVAGWYLHRMFASKMRGWENFLLAFIAVVVVHGLYDAVIMMEEFSSYAMLAPIFIALIAYQYFDPLRSQMEIEGLNRRVSPLGIFILGSVALTCIVLIGTAPGQPVGQALGTFAISVASMIPLAFAFISRFRDL